jgi:hypothetical protein
MDTAWLQGELCSGECLRIRCHLSRWSTGVYKVRSVKTCNYITLQRVEPLLCNDREICEYNRAVSRQLLCKYVPAATDRNATMVQQERNGVFYAIRADMLLPGGFGTAS